MRNRRGLLKKAFLWLVFLISLAGFLTYEYRKAALLDAVTALSYAPNDHNPRAVAPEGMVLKKYSPINVVTTPDGSCFFEFEKAWFGTIEFELNSVRKEDRIKLRLGELAVGNHVVNSFKSGKKNIAYHEASIETFNNGSSKVRIELPSRRLPGGKILPFDLSGVLPIRYFEVTEGCSDIVESKVYQLALTYKFSESDSIFLSNNDILNTVYELAKHTIKATSFAGVYVDGYREMKPYEADSYINQLGHYAVDADFMMARRTQEYLLDNGTWPTEWTMHSIFMAYHDYMQTGDKIFLLDNYEKLKKRSLLGLSGRNLLISSANQTSGLLAAAGVKAQEIKDIVDWPINERDDYEMVPVRPLLYVTIRIKIILKNVRLNLVKFLGFDSAYKLYLEDVSNLKNELKLVHPTNTVVNAFHYAALSKLAFLAEELGKMDEAVFYKNRSENLRDSIQELLFDSNGKLFLDAIGSSHSSKQANVFALNFGLVPTDDLDNVIDLIIASEKGSVYLYQYLLEALYENNRSKEAFLVLTATNSRSWYGMVSMLGSSMTTESWNFDINPNMDMSHAWATAPVNIIPRYLVGIRPLSPRYKRFVVSPMDAELEFYKMRLPTLEGNITVEMQRNEERIFYTLIFTGNKTADLFLIKPDCDNVNVLLNSNTLTLGGSDEASKRISILGLESGEHQVEINCGNKYANEHSVN